MTRWMGLVVLLASACTLELKINRPRPPAPPPRSTGMHLSISSSTLPNGLRVVVVRDPRAAEMQVTTRYRVGAVDDGIQPGMAHLVEHLMFQQQLDGEPLFTRLEDTATYFNATTTFDATTYTTRAPLTALDTLLSIEILRLQERCGGITEVAFTREREVVVTELAQRDETSEILGALHAALYPDGHPYRRMIGGSAASVRAITREQACAFADAHYAPGNAVLVISGALSAATVDAALAKLRDHVTARTFSPQREVAAVTLRPMHVEVDAPVDEDLLVLTWPLPADADEQVKVRAIAAALPRLVDNEIKGTVAAVEIGDRRAPLLGLAVLPGDGETITDVVRATRLAVDKLPTLFRDSLPENLEQVLFERVKQGAIYGVYAGFEDGSDRDERIANYALAGHDPNTALANELRALRELSRREAASIATRYLATLTPTVVTVKAGVGRKRGTKVSLRSPMHDFGKRRAPVDPALAKRPADIVEQPLPRPRTRTLANGLEVVLLPASTVPTLDARIVFAAGTGDELLTRRGVALLAAHTLTFDLRNFQDVLAFMRSGGLRSVDVTSDSTTFAVQGLDANLDVVLASLRRWVRDGVYDDSATSFFNVMRSAAKRADDQGPLTDAWRTSLFGREHPYVTAGVVRHAYNALTLLDASQFRAAYYQPDNATLVIAGSFDVAAAERWIDYLFASWNGKAVPRRQVPLAGQPAAIAKSDDTALVQVRVALPAPRDERRAVRLVASEMLSEIARDVRYRLAASYTFDASLVETRLASFYLFAGWIDAPSVRAATELVRDRIAELQRDGTVAARAFVVARRHVLTQLGARISSASALADRVVRDFELGRQPLSDLQTAADVKALTIDDMRATLSKLDLAGATVLMDGPQTEVTSAFEVLGRKPMYVTAPPLAPPSAAPGTIAPSFEADEQRVLKSELTPSLTDQPPPRLMLTVGAGAARAYALTETDTTTIGGFSASGAVGYRYGWNNAIGVHVDVGRLTTSYRDAAGASRELAVVPVNVMAMWHLGGPGRGWGDLLAGLHRERFGDLGWFGGTVYGAQGGLDLVRSGVHRFAIAGRFQSIAMSTVDYWSFSLGLVYHR